jgi:hypothetical protein
MSHLGDTMNRTRTLAAAAAMLLLTPVPALAHDVDGSRLVDDGVMDSGKEIHDHDSQHGGDEGHLPATQQNVRLVGKGKVADGAGRTADVSAKGNYAYLARFRDPECSTGGIDIVDISNPAAPKHVSTVSSHAGTYTGEGSQVVTLSTAGFKGDLLVYNNEICSGSKVGIGGVTLVDVTNPLKPKKLVEGFGDFTVRGKSQTHANEIHSAFAWQAGSRAYTVMVDDEEGTDVDILDITNPSKPVLISETDLAEKTAQPLGAVHGDAAFLHDMVVKAIGGRQIMLASYWDGGYVQLDVTDPAKPVYLRDTDYPALDPVRLAHGQSISPEGNGHQAEFTRDNQYFIATDEDFDPYRVTATITGGPYAATEFTAIQGSAVPQINATTSLTGPSDFVGLACESLPAGSGTGRVAVIERGICDFSVKIQIAEAAGYIGAVVFNRTGEDGCEALVTMLAEAGIPAVFVSRTDGFRILGRSLEGYACSEDGTGTTSGSTGPVSPVDIKATFDGWGYVHLYNAKTMAEVGTYAIPEGQSAAYAEGFGDLSVHEVATDPDTNLGYLSYYAGGIRVVKYGATGLTEVGKFIDEGGNNFWGVEVHRHPNGQKYILASDRDYGLYIFQYTGP